MAIRIDIDVLQALCAIDTFGGVTRAAVQLSISQSAVSHKIKRLEDQLGRSLLSRRKGQPLFTDDGLKLLGYARRILTVHDEALLNLTDRPLQGKIRFGMTEDTTSSSLSRVLARFARRHPDVTVHTHVDQSRVLEQQLHRGEVDLAVMQLFTHWVKSSDTVLFEDRLHWVKSPDLDLVDGKPIPFLAFDDNCFYKHWANEFCETQGFDFSTVLTCASTAGIVSGVLSGLGVSLLNERHIHPDMQIIDSQIGQLPPCIAYVIRIANKSKSDATRALAQELARENTEWNRIRAA